MVHGCPWFRERLYTEMFKDIIELRKSEICKGTKVCKVLGSKNLPFQTCGILGFKTD